MAVTVSRYARQLRQSSRRQQESEAWPRTLLQATLDDVDGGVRLQVRDDGQGFDTSDLADVGPHHVGTATMRGRAAAADGTVDIHSAPGEGTVVSAWLPCSAAVPAAR